MKNRTAPRRQSERNKRSAGNPERGNALLAVIGIVGVLSALAVAYQAAVQSQSRTFDALAASMAGQNAVDAAVNLGVWRVVREWRAEEAAPGEAAFHCVQNGVLVRLGIENETRRLNLNLAEGASIARVLADVGFSPSRAASIGGAIADYVDRDDASHEGGSERERFAAAGATAPKNRPLDVFDELRLVPGVDAETYEALRGVLSIHSTRSDRGPANSAVAGQTAPPPRGVYRVSAATVRPDGRTIVASRIAVIEIDPARPYEPAIRAWLRGAVRAEGLEARGVSTQLGCRQVVLGA